MSILPHDYRMSSFGSLEEQMNMEGKGGGYLKKDFFSLRKNKTEMEKITFGDGKYICSEENKAGKEN